MVFGLLVEACILVIGAVWAVAKVNTTAAVLNANIRNLDRTVAELSSVVRHLDKKLDDHEVRLSLVETKEKE